MGTYPLLTAPRPPLFALAVPKALPAVDDSQTDNAFGVSQDCINITFSWLSGF